MGGTLVCWYAGFCMLCCGHLFRLVRLGSGPISRDRGLGSGALARDWEVLRWIDLREIMLRL